MRVNKQHNFIPALDGLRGLAILMVISYHYFPGIKIFSIGWSGVDLFFVLSGYLITGRLLATLKDKDYFFKFYRNRILRIFPLYYAVLIFFYAAIYYKTNYENSASFSYYTLHWKSFFVFTENWLFIFKGLPADSYLNHFWSLAIEEQFYFVWPWVIYFISGARARLWIICIITIIVIAIRILVYQYDTSSNFNYYFNTFCRIDSLMIGAILCQLYSGDFSILKKWVKYFFGIFFLITISGILIFRNAGLYSPFMGTIGYTCLAICYACLIYMVLEEYTFIKHIFNFSFLRLAGKISFGLYVFHWPVLLIMRNRMSVWGFAHTEYLKGTIGIITLAVSLAVTWGLSILSYRYFESYFLKYKS